MVLESIPNFDSYMWIAVGLFIAGLFSIMAYEKSNSQSKQEKSTDRQ